MKRTINRGEKIMKGRFFTLIIGLCLVASSAMATEPADDADDANKIGNIGYDIYATGGKINLKLPTFDLDLSKGDGTGSGTGSSTTCETKIPAVEIGKLFTSAHAINKYTQLETSRATFDYLTTMGIYNGTVADVSFNGKGGVSSWTTSQYTPGYWGTQNSMIDVYNNNPWLLMGGTGMGGSGFGGYAGLGGFMSASNYARF